MKIKEKQCSAYSMYYQHSFVDGCILKFSLMLISIIERKKRGKGGKRFLDPNDHDLSLLLVLFLLLSNWVNLAK